MTSDRDTPLLADQAYSKLRERIIFRDVRAGQSFDEQTLSRQLNIGRTPVREAVQRLAREGLLTIIPRKGIIVSDIGLETVREMFEARLPCEAQIARLAAQRATPDEIDRIHLTLSDADRLIDERRFRELLLADEQFHLSLASAAKNKLLYDILARLYSLGVPFWCQTLEQRPVEETKQVIRKHLEIVECIRQRDPDGAANAVSLVVDPNQVLGIVRNQGAQQ